MAFLCILLPWSGWRPAPRRYRGNIQSAYTPGVSCGTMGPKACVSSDHYPAERFVGQMAHGRLESEVKVEVSRGEQPINAGKRQKINIQRV